MEPGVYAHIPEEEYHADRASLSSSGARRLLPPSCPALFRHEQVNGHPEKSYFDRGHAVHRYVLGAGADIVSVDADSWRTTAAKELRAEAYASGGVPLLTHEAVRAQNMADAVLHDPDAGDLFADGHPELSLWWRDTETGVMLRARPDWMTERGGRTVLVDLKTTSKGVDRKAIAKACAAYGYHQQHPWYTEGIRELGIDDNPAFLFVFVADTAPHLVTVCELDPADVRDGHDLNRRAIEIYARCVASDTWPGHSRGINRITLPAWNHHNTEEILTDV